MKKKIYDTVVVGLGAMGSSSLYHLSKSGASVLGLEKFVSPHKNGSTFGESRITREAYFEGLHYVQMAQRAHQLWDQLEKDSGTKVWHRVGGLYVGLPQSEIVTQSKEAADKFKLPHKMYTAKEINKKYKYFSFPEDQGLVGVEEVNAGALQPEKCIKAHLSLAQSLGAEIRFNTSISAIDFDGQNKTLLIKDNFNNQYEAKNIVLSCGSWLNDVLSTINFSNTNSRPIKLQLPLKIEKNYIVHYKFKRHPHMDQIYQPFPIFLYQPKGKSYIDMFYGFPDLNEGIHFKIALYHLGEYFNKWDEIDRTITEEHRKELFNYASDAISHFNRDNIEILKEDTCLYTTSPDHDFIMDYYPEIENIFICSPCSGHGFKFSSRIGEYVANLYNKKEKLMKDFSLERLSITKQ